MGVCVCVRAHTCGYKGLDAVTFYRDTWGDMGMELDEDI